MFLLFLFFYRKLNVNSAWLLSWLPRTTESRDDIALDRLEAGPASSGFLRRYRGASQADCSYPQTSSRYTSRADGKGTRSRTKNNTMYVRVRSSHHPTAIVPKCTAPSTPQSFWFVPGSRSSGGWTPSWVFNCRLDSSNLTYLHTPSDFKRLQWANVDKCECLKPTLIPAITMDYLYMSRTNQASSLNTLSVRNVWGVIPRFVKSRL